MMDAALLVMAALVSVMGSVGADSRPLTGVLDGNRLVVSTSDGVRCEGSVLKMTDNGGLGSLHCSDGRRGSFEWSVTSRGSASGSGSLGGEPLELTFTLG